MNTCSLCVLCTGAQARSPFPGCHTCLPAALEFWPPGAHSSRGSLEAQVKRAVHPGVSCPPHSQPMTGWYRVTKAGSLASGWEAGAACSRPTLCGSGRGKTGYQTPSILLSSVLSHPLLPFLSSTSHMGINACLRLCFRQPDLRRMVPWTVWKNGLATHHEATRTCHQWWAEH